MIRIVVVEDHAAIAEGLAALLGGYRDLSVVAVARDEPSARAAISSTHPDVVLCDVMLTGRDDGFRLLSSYHAESRFVMYSAFDFPAHHVRAIDEGAAGYVSKMADADEIAHAIRRVASGGLAFGPEILSSARHAARRPTPREQQVLELLVDGASNDEMARRLGLRVKTVEGTIRRLFDRYSVDNRTQLARYASQQGWLTSDPLTPGSAPDGTRTPS